MSNKKVKEVVEKEESKMKTKVEVIVEYAGENLSAYIDGIPVMTTGRDLPEVKANIQEAVGLYVESCREMGVSMPNCLEGEFEFTFKLDTPTFINYYSGIFTKAALSRITGINERQLWHYAAGVHKPRRRQLEKIENGIRVLTTELSSITMT